MKSGRVWEEGNPVGLNPWVIKYLGTFLTYPLNGLSKLFQTNEENHSMAYAYIHIQLGIMLYPWPQ